MMPVNPFLILVPLLAIAAFVLSKRQGKTTKQAVIAAGVTVVGLYAVAFVVELFIE